MAPWQRDDILAHLAADPDNHWKALTPEGCRALVERRAAPAVEVPGAVHPYLCYALEVQRIGAASAEPLLPQASPFVPRSREAITADHAPVAPAAATALELGSMTYVASPQIHTHTRPSVRALQRPTSRSNENANEDTNREAQVIALSAVGGAITFGAGGGVMGGGMGVAAGAAVGIIPALFTFGLSIPVGAVIGGGMGLCVGTAAGTGIGLLSGSLIGHHYIHTKNETS